MLPPTDPAHSNTTDTTEKCIYELVKKKYKLLCQHPIELGDHSEPVPDVAIVKSRSYKEKHPTAADTLLVIEVANTSLKDDLHRKRLMYAKASIPEYWVLDLTTQTLHVFTKPKRGDYSQSRQLEKDETVTATSFRGLKVKVAELLA